MLGPKITTVFRSRWNALFWAAGVLLTAYCSIPAPGERNDAAVTRGLAADSAQVAGMAASLAGEPERPEPHRNPWAKDPDPASDQLSSSAKSSSATPARP